MSSIKDLNVTFEAINEDSSYSEGDTIVGTVSFRLTRDVKVKSLSVKAKGDAKAEWTEGVGECQMTYKTKKRYFKLKEYLIAENGKGTVLPKGAHAFKFSLQIPEGSLPSSFKGNYGKIVYMFEAKISRSCWWSSKVKQKINFISKSFLQFCEKMCPHSGSVSKKMSGRTKGEVHLSATIIRNVSSPGESLSVVAKICNSSSKDMRPKFKLEQRTVYCCQNNTTESAVTLLQMVGGAVSPNSEQTASCQLKIPEDAIPTLHNCEIISVEYYIKVYLDISVTFYPEVVFPLVIIPSRLAAIQFGEAVEPYAPETIEATSYSNFSSPAFPAGIESVPTGSGATPEPIQHDNITSRSYNQWPQGASPQGSSAPAFTSLSVQHPGPTALPHLLQGEQSPLYMSIYHHQNE
ncbi:arrestin domain-containing protein 3-like [Archocentrus centrarchus]|uniref:arrestin domain-containing protein 3-like n=1 Tax=Archocentrus centrarchus TaxID=63155 RepID=UPI0011E9C61D|nr:arrestin domain-containing protein 3-like [Archocentrus centrarchus]